jgi:hypothetical protein
LEASTTSIDFASAECEERQRKMQAGIERMAAASTLEEQQRIGDQLWAEYVERPRGARRVQTARRVAPSTSRPTRPGRVVVKRRSRSAKTGTPTRGDPDDGDSEPPPSRRVDGRRDIEAWLADRERALAALRCCGTGCSRCVRRGKS